MRYIITLLVMAGIGIVGGVANAETNSASKSKIAGAVVENMASTDVVRFAVSPVQKTYDYKVVCGDDSIRVRLNDIGAESKDIMHLDTPRGSTLRKVRLVPQLQNRSVLQIHPRGAVLEACARTSVISLDGNLVVSIALTDSQKTRRTKLLNAHNETREALKNDPEPIVGKTADSRSDKSSNTEVTGGTKKSDNGVASPVTVSQTALKANDNTDRKSVVGTIFDKSKESDSSLKSDEEVQAQTMKYAGALLFAAILGFFAWYTKKKRNRFQIDEDNIDILSRKRVGTHQTLMVARVNGSRFLLAVGDKSVASLGLIPTDGQTTESVEDLRTDIRDAVKESLAREPRISATPYSEIRDDDDISVGATQPAVTAMPTTNKDSNFGSDFQRAIDKIVRDRNKPIRERKARTDAGMESASKALSDAFSMNEGSSNVSGLISMARMRAALENQSSPVENQYRA